MFILKRYMLSGTYRFHGRRSLGLLFGQGKTVRSKSISLKFFHNSRRPTSRCAVVVGRKITKSAPMRNRIRRRIYEIVRVHWPEIQSGYDLAFFIYDVEVATMPYAELEATVIGLLRDAAVIVDLD